jgi:branched-chain amino acid transport system permease protein
VYATHGLGQLLMTIGLAFILTAIVKNLAGPQLQTLPIPSWLQGNVSVGPVTLSVYRGFLVGVGLLVASAAGWRRSAARSPARCCRSSRTTGSSTSYSC